MKAAALGLVAVVLLFASVRAEIQQTFHSGTDVVSVYATVTDDSGRLVPNLTKDDFTVYDDGKVQPLTYFSNEPQPISVVMMFDRSGSMAEYFDVVRDAGIAFIKTMLPDDRGRIGSFSTQILIDPETFTSDQEILSAIMRDRLQRSGPSPVWAAIDASITAVSKEQGRRVVLVFTDGHDDAGHGFANKQLADVEHHAVADDVMVYSIGFADTAPASNQRGYGQPPPVQPRFPAPTGPTQFPPRRYQMVFPFGRQSRNDVTVPPDPGLKVIAEESGGGYFEFRPKSDLKSTFTRVSEELHRQYWLGFAPTRLDGQPHRIEVTVKENDLHVRARRTYIAGGSE